MNFAAFFWPIEFALELLGAFRSRNLMLRATFGYLAAADIACFIATQNGWGSYMEAYWLLRAGKYLFLCSVSAVALGKMVKSSPRLTAVMAIGLAFTAGIMSYICLTAGEPIWIRLLDSSISAAAILGAVLALGWVGRSKNMPRDWKVISAGMLILLGGDVVILIAAKLYWPAHNLKWFPELIQLAMWNYAAKVGIGEARLPLSRNLIATEEVRGAVQ